MAGGKETPRQKMIGMMYLVLTALLALNVSKSILDAFVAIEENIQKANIVQSDRGTGFYNDVTDELAGTKGKDQEAKKKKLQYVIAQMDKINAETEKVIGFLDQLKVDILNQAGENTAAYKDKDELNILWKKQNGTLPARMHLAAVQGQDKYDEPMLVLGIAEDIKNPTGKGAELWKTFNGYRSTILELTGSYKWGEKTFSMKPSDINEYETNAELIKKVTAMVDASKGANLKEDRQVLIDLYMMLTKKEKNEVHEMKDVHWVGMTFDHSPLVAAIAALSSMEQDVLSARALAMAHWKSKVSTGEYSFNKIMPLAYGPGVVNNGDDVELQVMMAAFDSDNQPVVTVTEGATAEIEYKGDGQGRVKFKAGGSNMSLKGTVAIKNKSGVKKVEKWEYDVVVMKPQGSIELPDLNVLYRGYNNKVLPVASGYPQTVLGAPGCSISKSGEFYIVRPGSGSKTKLSVSGKTADGKTVNLRTVEYRVSNLPDPVLYWGSAKSGAKAAKSSRLLLAKYPPEIPLNAEFTVLKWTCFAPGLKGAPPTGAGGNIGSAGPLINAVQPGAGLSFNCTVKGPDGIARQIGGSWSI